MKDHYKTLGISYQPTIDEIEVAYEILSLQNQLCDDSTPEEIQRHNDIEEAYIVLTNTIKRLAYDVVFGEYLGMIEHKGGPTVIIESENYFKSYKRTWRERYASVIPNIPYLLVYPYLIFKCLISFTDLTSSVFILPFLGIIGYTIFLYKRIQHTSKQKAIKRLLWAKFGYV
ncbi:MAG: DnaJ domain-containing protein [Bacteroidota bacterium]